MLISSKTKNEKIILGLLSYTYEDGKASMEDMKHYLETYRQDPNLDILLYKDEDSENFIGLICIERNISAQAKSDEQSLTIIVHRIAVVPSFRDEGVGYKIYESLRKQYPNAAVIGAMNTVDLLSKWSMQYNQN